MSKVHLRAAVMIWLASIVGVMLPLSLAQRASASVHSHPLVTRLSPPVRWIRTGPGDYFADFGLDWFGQLHLRIDSPSAGKVITVLMGEKALPDGRVNPHPGGQITFYKTHLTLLRGVHLYNVPLPRPDYRRMPASIGAVMPFRYAEILGCPSTLHRRDVLQMRVHYQFNRRAAQFDSSNKNLNAVWSLCHHTIEATSFCGIFADGNRERRPYEADDLIAELDWFNNTTDTTLPEITDRYLIDHPTWPTEWIMQSVLMAWYDYLYTGHKNLIENNYAALKAKTLVALERPDGLISTVYPPVSQAVLKSIYRRKPIRDIVDWPPDMRDGYVMRPINTVVNAFHYRSMVLMSRIAAALGHKRDARYFSARARLIRRTMNRLLINPATGLYVDGIGTTHSAIQANLFPLAFGIPPRADRAHIADFLVKQGMRCSVYGAQYLLMALYRTGRGGAALKLMTSTGTNSWMHMLAEGTTMTAEAWTFRSKPNEDWNHVWGAAPANIIPRYLMGIRPGNPGFTEAIIAPQPGNLTFAHITVPTVRGQIVETIRQGPQYFQMAFTLPHGISAAVSLPPNWRNAHTITLNGTVLHSGARAKRLSKLRPGHYVVKALN